MDWEGLATAYLDRERSRLGLPSREELAMKRAEEARTAAAAASQLESAEVGRDLTRAKLAALPAEQDLERRLREAQIRNYDEQPQGRALSGDAYLMSLDPAQQAALIKFKGQLAAAERDPRGPGGNDPRTGWKEVYGPNGKLAGFTHPAAGFRTPEQLGMPADSRIGAPTAGERESLALGSVPIRASDTMRKALEATKTAESAAPLDPSTWTGPVAGRAGGVYRQFVDTSGPAGDFENARDEARSLVYALSGKQINQQEQAWLDRLTPRLSDRGVEQQMERFDRFVNYLRAAKAQGFSDPFAVARQQIDSELPSAAAPPQSGATTTVRNASEYAALPSGTIYFDPSGKRRRKP